MKEYFNFVENLAKNKENKDFFNSGPIHASIVMSRIFKYSNNEVKIFCGGFTGAVSNDPLYLSTLEEFLEKPETKMKILVEDYENNKTSKVYSIFKKYKSKVEIFTTPARVVINDTERPIHFTLGDNKMLRLETNPEDFTAQVNFNSTDSSSIVSLFDDIYANPANVLVTP